MRFDMSDLEYLSELGPVAYLLAALCLFVVAIGRLTKNRPRSRLPTIITGILGIAVGVMACYGFTRIARLQVVSKSDYQRLREEQRNNRYRRFQRQQISQPRDQGERPRYGGRMDLVERVRKLSALTGGVNLELETSKAVAISTMLEAIASRPTITNEEANEMIEELRGKLTPGQWQLVNGFSLPREMSALTGRQRADGNPFFSETDAKLIHDFRERYSADTAPVRSLSEILDR
ncbi:MAG: hypothetical protein ACKVHO_05000 [Verrucomicrobiia bacterium]|jgi:hypothetical protein